MGSGGHNIAELKGIVKHTRGNEATNMSHVHHEKGSYTVCDLQHPTTAIKLSPSINEHRRNLKFAGSRGRTDVTNLHHAKNLKRIEGPQAKTIAHHLFISTKWFHKISSYAIDNFLFSKKWLDTDKVILYAISIFTQTAPWYRITKYSRRLQIW